MAEKNIVITGEDADRLLAGGDGAAALVYLHALRRGELSVTAAAGELGMTEEAVSAAAASLRSMGLLQSREPLRGTEMPEYSAADIVSRTGRDRVFEDLVDAVQHSLGRLLSTPDMKLLFGIYDHLGLPAEVIMLLVTHCIETYRESHGEGRVPTMRYIEKEAWYWAGQEIVDMESAEEHIRRENERKSSLYKTAELMQIRGRELSPGERRYIEGWLDLGFGPEALAMAYDRTVLGTGKLAWRYMDKIVRSWHEKGLHSPEAIQSGEPRQQRRPAEAEETPRPAPGADPEVERLRRVYERMNSADEQ